MRSRQSGFTLIEMMTVLAIVAILTMTLASLTGTRAGTPRSTAHEITGIIEFAKLRAGSRRSIHKVQFESSQIVSVWESVMGATSPQSDTPRTGFGTPTHYTMVQSLHMPNGVLLWAADRTVHAGSGTVLAQDTGLGTPFEITIFPDGSSDGGTIFLTSGPVDQTPYRFRVFVYTVTGTALSREVW